MTDRAGDGLYRIRGRWYGRPDGDLYVPYTQLPGVAADRSPSVLISLFRSEAGTTSQGDVALNYTAVVCTELAR